MQITDAASNAFLVLIAACSGCSALTITTTDLPGGTVGTAYSATMAATGGVAPYTWAITSGTLPPGILMSTSGVFSGTPTKAGTFNFTVQAKDSTGATVTLLTSIVTGNYKAGTQHTVILNWTASTSSNVIGYNVYRGTASSGPYTKLTSTPVAGSTYYDHAVQAGQTYYYVATAVDTGGNESAYSTQVQAAVPFP
jgi:hypothetical protein